jgi:Flp pilus assembly protein TadG
MQVPSSLRSARRGGIAPLAAILLAPLIALLAFSVDVGYIVTTQTELQNAADAAALAGASKLEIAFVPGGVSADTLSTAAVAKARSVAKVYSSRNTAGGVNLQLADADIIVGYQASPGDAVTPWAIGQPLPNAVQVTVRRDSTLNNPLPLYIGPVIGTPTWSGTATATAAFQARQNTVTGFNTPANGKNPLLLPIGVDVAYWNAYMLTGMSPDGLIHDSYTAKLPTATLLPPNNVSNGADNIPELMDVYPNVTSPGNFGLVNLNYTNPVNNDPTFSSWIRNGPSPSDIATFGANGFQATPTSPVQIKGGPGLKSNLVGDLNAIIGQPRVVPLFSSYSGQGSNTYYTIVGFAGVTVVRADGNGSNETIAFQALPVVDTTATTGANAGNATQFVYPTSPLRLTR